MFTVHDCFAVTADKVALLVKTMTAVHIKIYHDDAYLLQFDKRIREALE